MCSVDCIPADPRAELMQPKRHCLVARMSSRLHRHPLSHQAVGSTGCLTVQVKLHLAAAAGDLAVVAENYAARDLEQSSRASVEGPGADRYHHTR